MAATNKKADWRQKKERMKADASMRARLRLQEAPELAKTRMKLKRLKNRQEKINNRVLELGADRELDDIPRRDQLKMFGLFLRSNFIDMRIDSIMHGLAKRELRKMQLKNTMDGLRKAYARIRLRKTK